MFPFPGFDNPRFTVRGRGGTSQVVTSPPNYFESQRQPTFAVGEGEARGFNFSHYGDNVYNLVTPGYYDVRVRQEYLFQTRNQGNLQADNWSYPGRRDGNNNNNFCGFNSQPPPPPPPPSQRQVANPRPQVTTPQRASPQRQMITPQQQVVRSSIFGENVSPPLGFGDVHMGVNNMKNTRIPRSGGEMLFSQALRNQGPRRRHSSTSLRANVGSTSAPNLSRSDGFSSFGSGEPCLWSEYDDEDDSVIDLPSRFF